MSSPVLEGWFTTGDRPTLLGTRCKSCATVQFPPSAGLCRNPACSDTSSIGVALSRTGRIWSYTDAQYQPPAPYVAVSDPYVPFAMAAVELPEGLVVLGQLADGFGVDDVTVGDEVELVVETLYHDESGERTIWRWRPTGGRA